MAKLKGPILSLSAGGTIGDSVIFSSWRGRPYAKKLTIPNNPNSAAQIGARSMLRFLSMNYASLSPSDQNWWIPIALERQISPYNFFCSYNLERWRAYLLPTKIYPATESAPARNIIFAIANAALRGLDLIIPSVAANLAWGITIHRSTVTGFTRSSINCIQVIYWPWAFASEYTYHDPNLDPGTYYYKLGSFSESGRNTPDPTFEFSGTVT